MKQTNYILIMLYLLLISCDSSSILPGAASSPDSFFGVSQGGSTAKFAIKDHFLYIVDSETLSIFDVSNEAEASLLKTMNVGWGVETIFPFDDLLLLGTQSGVLFYDISTPTNPYMISNYQHIVSCDPVVTDGEFAYLTLRTGTNCRRAVNELHVIDMTNITNPVLKSSMSMSNPKGLAIHNNILYVCDDGVKIFDATNKNRLVQIGHIEGIAANDVIFHRNQLLVTADNGFYQFSTDTYNQLSFYTFL